MNVPLHIKHWHKGAEEALSFAEETVERGRIQFGLFFAHLALEKALKAQVCRVTKTHPPYTHNLVRLAELAEIKLTEEQKFFLGSMNEYNISGRYSEFLRKTTPVNEAKTILDQTKKVVQWLLKI